MARPPRHETPVGFTPGPIRWVSDLLAEVLRGIGVEYVVQVPGSSYSALHDSIVNHLGNRDPQLIMALHEETAVAIAHGYAKATGRMMAVALHANIGLLRAPMAIYNAWCDRAPVLILGGTGPRHEALRNVSDWIHSGSDHGGLVRDFTKWDDEPGSAAGAVEALFRARQIAQTAPRGPVFVNFVADLQESRFVAEPTLPEFERYAPPNPVSPAAQDVEAAARLLSNARHPLILLGRCSRDPRAWEDRVELAERLDAPVLTQIRNAAAFPTDHALHVAPPFFQRVPPAAKEALAAADVVLALDWSDLQDTLSRAFAPGETPPRIINVSCDAHNHRGWSDDHRGLAPADLYLMCETDPAVRALLSATGPRTKSEGKSAGEPPSPEPGLTMAYVAATLRAATSGLNVCYTRLPFRWQGGTIHFRHPADYIGYDGGSGIGSGPGITVGAALGLLDMDRLAIGVMGDGDFIMGNTALWTAVHYRIPALLIVINNRSFATDEVHQRSIAAHRERAPGNEWIGCRIDDPNIDIAQMARSMGAVGIGPVIDAEALEIAVEQGLAAALAGDVAVVDLWMGRPVSLSDR